MPIPTRSANALVVFALALAAAFIAVPAWQLLGPGPFDWHIAQPAYVQGGIEALVLLALTAGAFALGSTRAAALCAAAVLALYLRRHAVDVPLLLDLLDLEITIGLGMLVRRLFRLSPTDDVRTYLHAFVLGFVVWSLIAWSASALGFGSIGILRALTLTLGVAAFSARPLPLLLFLWRSMRAQDRVDRLWSGALVAWIAILYARTNVAIGYDSLWYGLRGEYMLDPGRSVFEPLGLVSPVHYFPKLYEMFLLPLSGMGDSSVLGGMTVWMLVLALLACACISARIGLATRARMPVLALIATLPALSAAALEPKPDVVSALFVLIAADAALCFTRSRTLADLAWLFTGATLGCMAKLTAMPYVGVLLIATLFAGLRGRTRGIELHGAQTHLALSGAAGSLAVAAFVTARTWLLTGMPTIGPDPLFRLWQALGMHLREPVGTLQWTWSQEWGDVPMLFIDWLFRPQQMPHIVISWTGNVWLWLAAVAAAAALAGARRDSHRHARWPLAALIVTGLVLATAIRYRERGSDGNYFLAALLPAVLLAAASAFSRLATAPRALAAVLASVPAFALFQAGYGFASAGWTPGTRRFDLTLTRSWHDTRRLRWEQLEHAGMERIGRYLKDRPGGARVVGYAAEPASFWLPARFENLLTILYSRHDLLDSPEAFDAFLREQRIAGLMLPQAKIAAEQFPYVAPAVITVATELAADPRVRRIDDRDYFLLDLSGRVDRAD